MASAYVKESDTFSVDRNGTVPKPSQADVSGNKVLQADGNWVENSGGGGGSSTLAGLSDVDTTGVSDGDLLGYDSSAQKWIPQTPSSGNVTDVKVNGTSVVNQGIAEINLTSYQTKTMSSSVTVDGSTKTTVESAISGLADLANALGLTVISGQVYQTVEEE